MFFAALVAVMLDRSVLLEPPPPAVWRPRYHAASPAPPRVKWIIDDLPPTWLPRFPLHDPRVGYLLLRPPLAPDEPDVRVPPRERHRDKPRPKQKR